MEVSGQPHITDAYPVETIPDTHWIEGWAPQPVRTF